MAKCWIGTSGVASEIGALGRDKYAVNIFELIAGICDRFGATLTEAIVAINNAEKVGAVEIIDHIVYLMRD